MADAVRLAVGTLTLVPVRPPERVDRGTAARALLWAPAVGAGLGMAAAVVLEATRFLGRYATGVELLAAALAVATWAR